MIFLPDMQDYHQSFPLWLLNPLHAFAFSGGRHRVPARTVIASKSA